MIGGARGEEGGIGDLGDEGLKRVDPGPVRRRRVGVQVKVGKGVPCDGVGCVGCDGAPPPIRGDDPLEDGDRSHGNKEALGEGVA